MSNQFARDTILSSIASFLFLIGRFATMIIIARVLGVDGTGVVNYAIWVVGFAGAVTDLGVYSTLTRYLPEIAKSGSLNERARLTNFCFVPFLLVNAFAIILMLISSICDFNTVLSGLGYSEDPGRLALVAVLFGGQVLGNFVIGYYQGIQRFGVVANIWIITSIAQIIFTFVGAHYWGSNGAILGLAAGFILQSVPCLWIIGHDRKIETTLRKRVIRFALFSWGNTIASTFVWSRPEMAILNYTWGSHAVGLYSVGITLSSIAIQAPMMLTGGLLPFFAQNSGPDGVVRADLALARSMKLFAVCVMPLGFGVTALVPSLLPTIFGPDFSGGTMTAMIVVLGAVIGANVYIPMVFMASRERNDAAFLINSIMAALSVLFAFLLVPQWGAVGAGASRAFIQISLTATIIFFVVRIMEVQIPFRSISIIVLCSLISATAAFLIVITIDGFLGMAIAIGISISIYLVLVKATGTLTSDDAYGFQVLTERLPPTLARFISCMINSLTHGK